MRVAFFGTPTFAVPTLEALLASRHEVAAVITQPDRPSGRGHRLSAPPVKLVAAGAGIPCWQPDRLKAPEFLAAFAALGVDAGIVAAYGKILPQVLIDLPRHGFLNVHASLLPRHRGASPIQQAVVQGDPETGVTIMRIVLALDAGAMFTRDTRPIGPDETSEDVERDLSHMGARLMLDTLDAIEASRAIETPQDDSQATFAPRLRKEDGLIDWSRSARDVHNLVRGLWPWPHAHTTFQQARLVVLRGSPAVPSMFEVREPPHRAGLPGTVLGAPVGRLVVATGEGQAYELLEVQPEGRRRMSARDFLAGHRIDPGVRFGHSTP